ncbi:uncharacterized protein LOC126895735 [Daktulosphaira vitifoliae]|uniref:uncharacterized protein LOC126895735 n=1 Tax=Daktulosphaira vitifoliae TaxID=58002 RepID=UPI0021AA5EBF|nr:uncharacterized protein LOC126895735 [Daktulosphaira vitifoliae]
MLSVYKYTPLTGSSYIPVPPEIFHRKAIINPQNKKDECCFKWAILARHVKAHDKSFVGKQYFDEEHRYDFTELTFPTPVSQIKIFERRNPNVSVNVYGLERDNVNMKWSVYPLRVADQEQQNHFDLLYIGDSDKYHYAYISNFSRLVRSQKTQHHGRIYTCRRCFTSFDDQSKKNILRGHQALEQHKLICGKNKPILPVMPAEGSKVEFDAWVKTQRLPFVIYADFEALLEQTDDRIGTYTRTVHTHHPMSYGFMVKTSNDVPSELLERYGIPQSPVIYRGSEDCEEVAKAFVMAVTEVTRNISKLLRKTNVPIRMSVDDVRRHGEKVVCDLCRTAFKDSNPKVADHCHLSGRFRQTLCNACNLKVKTVNFVPCFLHNLSGYDAHFIVTELGYDDHRISVIPNSEEKYISVTKHVTNNFSIRFVDTFRFMASSLSTLAGNLMTPYFVKFRETAQVFRPEDMPLVTHKGVYPYEYTDSWAKLDETVLPPRDAFYSQLNESNIDDDDYRHATEVWNRFGCSTLGEYSDLYLKIDVLLLADVFENFRDICTTTYNLDPAHYYTAPGFSFDCMLKYTRVKLELLNDYDMLLMVEQGIRGRLVQAVKHYAKANNPKTPGYDPTKPNSWIVYQDCNNLYGWAMSQPMPYGGFRWYEGSDPLADLQLLSDTGNMGRIYEIDVSYPEGLHDEHNDLPFLPVNDVPPGSKETKLMATLKPKQRYVVHYVNLKQAIAHGLQVDKVHRVLEFQQSAWLKPYIELNTEMRKQAANAFEISFFKLMNNAVFGKTMENMRKRIRIELISSPERLSKLVNQPTFNDCIKYGERLCAVIMDTKIVKFLKLIYVGLAVLDISKSLMYKYFYDVLNPHYGDAISLVYMDTARNGSR